MPLRPQALRLASISAFAIILGAVAGCGDNLLSPRHDAGKDDGGTDAKDAGGRDSSPDAGGDATNACYRVTFLSPVDMATLTADDDKSGDRCVDGFQIAVHISTTAPDGTDVNLFAGNALVGLTQVSAGEATFDVQIASSGDTVLSIQFPSTGTCTDASTKAKVSVDCNVPTCTIGKPTISGSHPALNGIPAAQGGDRVSATGSAYQAAFEVTTNVDDGQPVDLVINTVPATTARTVSTNASGGKATFAGVTLTPDGSFEIEAACRAKSGVVGRSMKGTYPVDTTPPNLTVSKPASGDFIGPGQLVNGKFQVCGRTTSADAAGLPTSLGAAASNFCLSGSTNCVAVTATGTDACFDYTCTGGAPFDITVALNDGAGNKSTATITGVACASSLPSVQIISPVSDAPTFTDRSKHLLAATAAQAFRDQVAGTAGAQTDVVACSSRAGTAKLFVGHQGDTTLSQLGGTVSTSAAVAADGCPAALGFVIRFPGVTLPESTEGGDSSLLAATELRVDVTDISTATGSSPPVDIWVDSVAPVISLRSPASLCGSFHQTGTTFTTAVDLASDTGDVTLTVTNGTSTGTLTNPTFSGGVATFPTVVFDQGQSNLAAVAADRAGNSTTLQPIPCQVTVGAAPVVTFTAPTPGQQLCAAGSALPNCVADGDAGTPGWQGSLTVHVTAGGSPVTSGNVTFSVGATTLGQVALNGSGDAQLPSATFFDGTVTITARTSDVPGHGVGTGTITLLVDTGPPAAPTGLTAIVLDRRQTSFQLSWTAPSDNGQPVTGYQVRYARVPITAANFDNTTVTTAVTYSGSPAAPGTADGVAATGLYIETSYYFAVAAVDVTGNRSPITATSVAVKASFLVSIVGSPTGTNQLFGAVLDGSADVNGDTLSDLVVGTAGDGHAYLYFGASTFAPSAPAVVFSSANAFFGSAVRFVGDIDGDTMQDVAIGDQTANRVLVYKGRLNWPLTLTDAQADYVITTDASWAGSGFGFSIAPLGDFDGDNVDDFVVGGPAFNARVGRAAVIYGRAGNGFTSFGLPDATRSLEIGGDPVLNRTQFGLAVVGLGHFYSVTTGTTLVVSGPGLGNATSTSANEGRLYAFHGRGPGAAITVAAADQVRVGPAKAARIGQTLVNLGPVVNGQASLGSGNSGDTVTVPGTSGTGYLLSGTQAVGPLSTLVVLVQSGTTGGSQIMFGGGFSGRDGSVSLIGDARPDVAISAQSSTTAIQSTVDIFDGVQVPGLSGTVDSTASATIHVPMPVGWLGKAPGGGNLIRDINGDGHPDFAIGDQFAVVPGRVAVFF